MIIVHCTLRSLWEKALESGKFGFDTMQKLGSIPCFKVESLTPENFTYPSIRDNIILCINTDKIDAEIKDENDKINICGLIDINAVISTINYTSDTEDKFTMNPELNDIRIINEILEKMGLTYASHQYFKDGSFSRTICLNGEYVIKQNMPELLKSEVLFSQTYESPKFQHILYYHPEYQYVVYHFVPGDVMHTVEDFDDLASNIKELTSSYVEYEKDGFGAIYEPHESWGDFLKSEVNDASFTWNESMEFLPQVYDAINVLEKYPFTKKLLHGDFGTHNFIKQNGKFVAAIDPIPTAGDPLYDVIYAFLGNTDLLPKADVNYIANLTSEPLEKVSAMYTIMLFCRLSICLMHHKQDFDTYIDFWYKHIGGNK